MLVLLYKQRKVWVVKLKMSPVLNLKFTTLQLFCGLFLLQTRYNQSGPCYPSAGQLGSAILLLSGGSFDWIPE